MFCDAVADAADEKPSEQKEAPRCLPPNRGSRADGQPAARAGRCSRASASGSIILCYIILYNII